MHSETYALNLFHFKVYFCYGNIFFIKLHIVVFLVFVFSYFKQVKEKQVFFFCSLQLLLDLHNLGVN